MVEMGDWANFLVAEVGASAALTGLVVVAISINLSRILSFPHLPGRAAEALILLGGVLVLTSAGLVPHQPMELFGIETLVIGLIMFLAPLTIQLRSFKADTVPYFKADTGVPYKMRRFIRVLMMAGPSLPIVAAGILLMMGCGSGLYLIAAGVILSLIAGVLTAWVLLIEILR
jgi:hypothetical protein